MHVSTLNLNNANEEVYTLGQRLEALRAANPARFANITDFLAFSEPTKQQPNRVAVWAVVSARIKDPRQRVGAQGDAYRIIMAATPEAIAFQPLTVRNSRKSGPCEEFQGNGLVFENAADLESAIAQMEKPVSIAETTAKTRTGRGAAR